MDHTRDARTLATITQARAPAQAHATSRPANVEAVSPCSWAALLAPALQVFTFCIYLFIFLHILFFWCSLVFQGSSLTGLGHTFKPGYNSADNKCAAVTARHSLFPDLGGHITPQQQQHNSSRFVSEGSFLIQRRHSTFLLAAFIFVITRTDWMISQRG